MDPIKEAFSKIKDEMSSLKEEITILRNEIKLLSATPAQNTLEKQDPTIIPAQTPTVPQEIGGFRIENNLVSTGNRGVPTDNPTNNQSSSQAVNQSKNELTSISLTNIDSLQNTLNSLDLIKKDIRLKFKRLTPQEMLVFSTLYSLESQGFQEITYKIIAQHLNLSESSIRDYFHRLLNKGIPVLKARLNNKKVVLTISPELQKIASLSTILRLREL